MEGRSQVARVHRHRRQPAARVGFKAHRLVYHSTLGLRVIKKKAKGIVCMIWKGARKSRGSTGMAVSLLPGFGLRNVKRFRGGLVFEAHRPKRWSGVACHVRLGSLRWRAAAEAPRPPEPASNFWFSGERRGYNCTPQASVKLHTPGKRFMTAHPRSPSRISDVTCCAPSVSWYQPNKKAV